MTSSMAYEFDTGRIQETLGSIADTCDPPSNANDSMLGRVLEKAGSIPYEGLRARTVNLVASLRYYVSRSGIGFELPRIVTDFQETDAYMEWTFPRFTLGFNISADGSQDGWFIVTDASLGDDRVSHHGPAPLDQVVDFVERFGDY